MIDPEDDWMRRLRTTTDRLREAAESFNDLPPKTVKRPSAAPAGVTARSANARSAYHRVQRKKGAP